MKVLAWVPAEESKGVEVAFGGIEGEL